MSVSFPAFAHLHEIVGRSPWTAADAPVGLSSRRRLISKAKMRVQGTAQPKAAPQFLQSHVASENQAALGGLACS